MTFTPYICFGDPNPEFSLMLVKAISPFSGPVEIGIPFSDPIADGPAIQGASQRALKAGATPLGAFEFVLALRSAGVKNDFIFMTYYNIIFSFGPEKFLSRMKEAGVQGIIIPDLPFGEDPEFEKAAAKYGVKIIGLVAQNTLAERALEIIRASEKTNAPFTYLVSSKGTTGARAKAGAESIGFVKSVRKISGPKAKLFVGFGISNSEQAKEYLLAGADGVIVGSEIINIYSKFIGSDGRIESAEAVDAVKGFVKSIAGAP